MPVTRSARKKRRGEVEDSAVGNDSSVLRELKETIKNQQKEIESLKRKVVASKSRTGRDDGASVASHSGGHGGGGAVTEDELFQYVGSSFVHVAGRRVGWLGLFLLSLSFTALIMNGFEHTLEKQIELAYFVPLLAGHGGNTGGQAVGTVLSALSAGALTIKDSPRVILKEAMSGLLVGLILGAIVGPVAHYIMGISVHVSTVIFFTLPLVSTIASTLGSLIPFACIWVGLDPSVIAGPAMTSFVDVTGLMAYFMIANQIFAWYNIEL